MTTITYTVTGKATSAARLNTEQVFDIVRLIEFKPPEIVFNRTYAPSLDGASGRGTLVSSHEVSRIGILLPITQWGALQELIYSLSDYQIAELDATDVPHFGSVRNFVMTSNNFPREKRGCNQISGSFDVRFIN
jgi:hypothetical protein